MIRAVRTGLYDLASTASARQQAQLRKVQEQAMTGLAINRPSDAPERLGEVHRLRAAQSDQIQWGANAERADELLSALDLALSDTTDILRDAREFVVGMMSETIGSQTRADQAQRAGQIRDALLQMSNTSFSGRYLFAGSDYGAEAFDSTGAYVGSTDVPEVEVGASTSVEVGVDGSTVFKGSVDMFALFDDLATALTADDTAGLGAVLDGLDEALRNVVNTRVRLGGEAILAEDAIETTAGVEEMLTGRVEQLVNADQAETYMDLASLQASYQATLQVVAKGTSNSLFDML